MTTSIRNPIIITNGYSYSNIQSLVLSIEDLFEGQSLFYLRFANVSSFQLLRQDERQEVPSYNFARPTNG